MLGRDAAMGRDGDAAKMSTKSPRCAAHIDGGELQEKATTQITFFRGQRRPLYGGCGETYPRAAPG